MRREFASRGALPAPPSQLRVVSLVSDAAEQRRQFSMLGTLDMRFCTLTDQLPTVVRSCDPGIILVEPWDQAGSNAARAVARLKAESPRRIVLVMMPETVAAQRELLALGRAGVDGVVVRGAVQEREHVMRYLGARGWVADVAVIVDRLDPILDRRTLALVRYCLESASACPTVSSAARALVMNRKTLFKHLTAIGLPSAGRIISWCRLLYVARLLEDSGRSLADVARAANALSSSAIRRLTDTHLGVLPSEIRALGGLGYALERFEVMLRDCA